MPLSPRWILLFLCIPGSLFLGNQLADEPEPREGSKTTPTPGVGIDTSSNEVGILQKQVQGLQEQVSLLEEENARLLKESQGEDSEVPLPDATATPPPRAGIESEVARALELLDYQGLTSPRIEFTNELGFRKEVRTILAPTGTARWEKRATVWSTLGLIPAETDLLACFEDMILETLPVVASKQDSLLTIAGAPVNIGQVVPPLSALHLGLAPVWTSPATGLEDDVWLARIALRLGEGARARVIDMMERPAPAADSDGMGGNEEALKFFRAPASVRDLFSQLGNRGLAAVQRKIADKAWHTLRDNINSHSLPTAAILHPAAPPAGWKIPPPLGPVQGIEPFWNEPLGELLTQLLLKQYVPERVAAEAATGWNGDLVTCYPSPNGHTQLRWETRWKSTKDAEQFFKALRTFQSNKFGVPIDQDTITEEKTSGSYTLTNQGRSLQIRYTSDRTGVILADASDETSLRQLLPTNHP